MELRYLEMSEISKAYPGVQALSDVSIGADEGEIIALLGENGAGKSTLMNVLGGVIKADSGKIIIGGQDTRIHSVSDAQRAGIAFIHQELSLFKQLTVLDNLFIDDFPRKKGTPFIDKTKMKEKAEKIIKELGVEIPINTQVSKLTMGQQQIIEIASAILKNAKIIILDEPTTSLTIHERQRLFKIVKKLKSEMKIILYITHDIENALELSDRVYVLRDGKNAGEGVSSRLTKEDVIRMMIGSKSGKTFFKSPREISSEPVLRLINISTKDKLKNVTLELKKGEVLGLYGLIGSGRTELIQAMYGLDKITSGKIEVKGTHVPKPSPKLMKKLGIAYLTENRRDEGLFLELGIDTNITITALDKIKNRYRLLSSQKESKITNDVINLLSISTPGTQQLAGKLSGGNQQKVVIGKWIHLEPDIFIMDEPTKGIDVGAKSEIYRLINELAKKGMSILLISSEIEEIMGICDRVAVMSNGSLVAVLDGENVNQSEIIRYAVG